MKINLCKLFNVEEGEEFKLKNNTGEFRYIIKNNILYTVDEYDNLVISTMHINFINEIELIKLPKKKKFTDDELCILKNIDSEFNVLGKNINGTIYVTSDCEKTYLKPFNNLFQSLDVGEEIRIDDYVERY